MAFRPDVNQELLVGDATYRVAEHPAAPGMAYGQEGRQAIVYQLVAQGGKAQALKVFKPRYRLPEMVSVAEYIAPYARLPGLQVCRRTVLTPQRHAPLLRQHPDLTYAVLMPWIEGPTWMEVLGRRGDPSCSPPTPVESLALARSLAEILAEMEQKGLAHCDLSGSNAILPVLSQSESVGQAPFVELVDVEQLYSSDLKRPELLPGGSPGYAHKTAPQGLWSATADRFAGAVLLAEMLGWCDERVRKAAWGENYFDPAEMQQDSEQYHVLVKVLREHWGDSVAALFGRAWRSETLADCPPFGEWLVAFKTRDSQREEENAMEQKDAQERLVRASIDKAEALIAIGQMDRALQELKDAYQLAPELAAENYARALVQQAAQREDAGDLEKALTSYQQALQVASEGSALQQEVAAIARRLETQLRGPVPAKTEEASRPAVRVEFPAGKAILWLAIMLIGWAGTLVFNRFTRGNSWLALVVWVVVGVLAGVAQWLAARRVTSVKLWWILVAPVGWAGCWGLGRRAAGMMYPVWFVEAGGDLDMSLVRNVQWGNMWHLAFLLNAVFNGTAAVWLLRSRPADSQPVSNTR